MSHRLVCIIVLVLLLCLPAFGQATFQGSAAILEKLPHPHPSPSAQASTGDSFERLRQDLQTFATSKDKLAPNEAGRQWMALVHRWVALESGQSGIASLSLLNKKVVSFSEVMDALPPPASWETMASEAEAWTPTGNVDTGHILAARLLTHTLVGDREAQNADIAALILWNKANGSDSGVQNLIDQASGAILQNSDDPQFVVKALQEHIKSAQSGGGEVEVPDLVTLLGPASAHQLLVQLLLQKQQISIPTGTRTYKMAQAIALQMIHKLRAPQWNLAMSLDSGPLYEAMAKRFPDTGQGDDQYQRQQAKEYYLYGLIISGEDKKAAAVAVTISNPEYLGEEDNLGILQKAGYAKEVYDFLYSLLSQHPELNYWDALRASAAAAGQSASVLTLVQKSLAKQDLSGRQRTALQTQLYKALLANNKPDQAIAIVKALLAQNTQPYTDGQDSREELGWTLIQVGRLSKRIDWLDQGIAIEEALAKPGSSSEGESGSEVLLTPEGETGESLVDVLIEIGRGAEAERLLAQALQSDVHSMTSDSSGYISLMMEQNEMARLYPRLLHRYPEYAGAMGMGSSGPTRDLIELCSLYSRVGRDSDVLYLIDNCPYWNAGDLAEVYMDTDSQGTPLGYLIAKALADTGSKDRAVAILQATLFDQSDFDPAYELLISIQGQQALPFLDTLFQYNQFEKRPLIWKAELLRRAGKLSDAEAAVRKAISIDPSDGNERYGRRFRAYAVLADILDAQGDHKQAADMRQAVTAIRIAEQADQYQEAGLLSQAIAIYGQALTHFADAYCIQSRLAIQYADVGDFKNAEAHYRRAYELMPQSFGRIESHCLGCEGAFRGAAAQGIAESVFSQLEAAQPANPQVHYLFGYLREEEQRYNEAAAEYEKAVALDPGYINAWIHLGNMSHQAHLPAAMREAIVLNLLRLDPSGESAESCIPGAPNLRTVWQAYTTAMARQPPPSPASLYPMPASQAERKFLEQQVKSSGMESSYETMAFMEQMADPLQSAGTVMTLNPIVAASGGYMDNNPAEASLASVYETSPYAGGY